MLTRDKKGRELSGRGKRPGATCPGEICSGEMSGALIRSVRSMMSRVVVMTLDTTLAATHSYTP